jgi:hypothetical protein
VKCLARLLADADVVTENYRGGTMEKFGLGYEELKRINPGLIYCCISGFGRTGPFADKGGFDLIAQGMSGLMSMTGEEGRPPIKAGSPVADINAGILAALGICRRLRGKAAHRAGPGSRHLAVRGRPAADVLAGRQLFRQRHHPAQDGLGQFHQHALSGVPHRRSLEGWLDQYRRGQPGQLRAPGGRISR